MKVQTIPTKAVVLLLGLYEASSLEIRTEAVVAAMMIAIATRALRQSSPCKEQNPESKSLVVTLRVVSNKVYKHEASHHPTEGLRDKSIIA